MDSTDMRSHILKQGISAKKTLEQNKLKVENFAADAEFDRIIINGAGDKYLIGLTASYLWRKLGREPLDVLHSRDLAENQPYMDENTLVIYLSQSGKTEDTMRAAKAANKAGAQSLVITNLREPVKDSLWFLKDTGPVFTTHTEIYPEVALPSTMTYHSTLSLLWHTLGELAGKDIYSKLLVSAEKVHELSIDQITERHARETAEKLSKYSSRYVFGDGPRYGLARKLGLIMFMEGVKVNAFPLETEDFLHSAIETLEHENKDKLPLVIFNPPKTHGFYKHSEKVAKFWEDFAPVYRIEAPTNDEFSVQSQMVMPTWIAYHEAILRGVDPGVSHLVNKVRGSGF
ncbi:MAG: SIS domain-containing protein [Candidatus Altiarchaeota archaeon]|nr:SIS domain-containing protein [Candidatus Altiarchaeota archaeon]